MAYCTSSEIADAIGSADLIAISDRDGDGAADAAVVASAISEADGLINSYASKRYAVPFDTASTVIKALSIRISVRVMRRNSRMVLASDVADEETDRKWLEDLAAGRVTPGVDPQPTQSELVVDKSGERDSTKNVSRNRLKGFW